LKKLLLILFVLLAVNAHARKYYYGIRPYTLAATVVNPLSATFKYGGGLEYRFRNVSYLVSYVKYKGGAYPGLQTGLDLRIYLRKVWLNYSTGNWRQNFIYLRGVAGSAGFDGPKLKMFGYDANIVHDEVFYGGGGAGVGRRWTFKKFLFISASAGVKYVALTDLDKEDKNLYRLFYATGPGSILELKFQFGLQI
jgi:hypothetical protein